MMKRVRIRWRGKEIAGLLVGPNRLRLDNGYEVIVKGEIIASEEIATPSEKSVEQSDGDIVIIATGGTIASFADYETGAVKPVKDIKTLIAHYEFLQHARIHNLMNKLSENMEVADWQRIAEAVRAAWKDEKPVVIMHGTDTMSYTAAALAFTFGRPLHGLVLTGSQRSSDRPSSDAYTNLKTAVMAAYHNLPYPLVAFHLNTSDEKIGLHLATRVRKSHTSRRDAIRSIGVPPVFVADWQRQIIERVWQPEYPSKAWFKPKFNTNVTLEYFYPGRRFSFEALSKYDGIVIMGTGLGHVHHDNIEVLTQLIQSDVPVVMTSQCIDGRVNLWVYETGRKLYEAGVIGHGLNILPEVAWIKTMWILAQTKGVKAFRRLYETNTVGEIQTSLPAEAFE